MSKDGVMTNINAIKCDGNPECYFGEDECLDECELKPKGPSFCDLKQNGKGYECLHKVSLFQFLYFVARLLMKQILPFYYGTFVNSLKNFKFFLAC